MMDETYAVPARSSVREHDPHSTSQRHLNGKRGTVSTTLYDDSLTAADRCDRCGAQAYLRVTLSGGGELLFCAHHATAHSDKLRQVALRIHDETDRVR